jgi:hypothetical protein
MNRPLARADLWLLAAVLVGCNEPARADSAAQVAPEVTPYRPSVSTPAALSAPGWLEAELGVMHAQVVSQGWRDSVPYTLKLAFNEDWGIRFSGDALVQGQFPDGRVVRGMGDLAFVLKRRFALDEHSALGLELGVSSPTARAQLHDGSGATDYNVNGIYSADVGPLHTDVNLTLTRFGATTPGTGRSQALWAVAVSGNLDSRWGLVGEFSGTREAGAAATGQFLLAASCSAGNAITWDLGVARGLTVATPPWQAFAGVTFLVARIF